MQDNNIFLILEELENATKVSAINNSRLSGCVYSGTEFNLSTNILLGIKIRTLDLGLDYALIQYEISKLQL